MRRQSQEKNKPNKQLANQLKSRLFEKGFSYGTLPSVKRELQKGNPDDKQSLVVALGRNSTSKLHQVIVKEQSTVFRRTHMQHSSSTKHFHHQQQNLQQQQPREDAGFITTARDNFIVSKSVSRAPSANRLNERVPSSSRVIARQSSKTESNQGKPQLSRAMTATVSNFNRQRSSKSIAKQPSETVINFSKGFERPQTAVSINRNTASNQARNLMEKLSGRHLIDRKYQARPATGQKKQSQESDSQQIKFFPVTEEQFVSKRPTKQLDRYIQMILKNVAHVDEFVYLKKSKNYEEDPYDLEVIDYGALKNEEKKGLKQYFTISKKGLCLYFQNNPKEFQTLNSWLEERSSFDRIKSLNFFKQFRKWKTLKMWNKIIMREKIFLISEQLKDKLFYLNDNLRSTILSVKNRIYDLEELRILTYSQKTTYNSESTYNLERFSKLQRKNRQTIKEVVGKCSMECREFVRKGFKKSIEQLKRQHKPSFNQYKPTQDIANATKKAPKSYTPSTKQAAYEQLQFPDNMDYEMRSKLRNQCMRFLRFSYLIDFVSLHTMKSIYDSSVTEFKEFLARKLQSEETFVLKEDSKDVRSPANPIFEVEVELRTFQEPEETVEKVDPFLLPPSGTDTIEDFKILAHVNLKVKKEKRKSTKAIKGRDENESDWQEPSTFMLPTAKNLCQSWLSLSPSFEHHYIEIINGLDEGLESLQCFERWSRHEEMNIYRDVLEEWDDKIADEALTEDFFLHPDEWIDASSNEQSKGELKGILEQSFSETTEFVHDKFSRFLRIYWEDQRINFDIFTDERLADPTESIQYSLEHLAFQKKLFAEELPFLLDKQVLRVKSKAVRSELDTFPGECLDRLYLMMPPHIQRLSEELDQYLAESIASLRISTSKVEDFVNQMKSLRKIDKELPKVKDKISFVGQIINILEGLKAQVKGVQKDASKNWKSIQTHLLQQMISLENAITKAEEGADKNMIRFAEHVSKNQIPALEKAVSKMEDKVQDKKYLSFDIEMGAAIRELEEYDRNVLKYEEDAKKISEYEIVLNMPETRLQELQELRADLNVRLDLWRSLRDWEKMSADWMSSIFDEIDVEEIKRHTDNYGQVIRKCTKKIQHPSPVLDKLKTLLRTFKDAMPVVIALSNKRLQQDSEYWGEIQKIVKCEFVIDKEFSLKNLIDREFHIYQNEIIEISTLVKQEEILKQQIEENKQRWTKLEFAVKEYKAEDPKNKDAYVLDQVEDLYSELDELLANFSSILSNRYLKRQRAQAEDLQKVIFNAILIVDDWLVVQKNWIYLESIFSSSDIKAKLREESMKFEQIDKSFKNHMRMTFRTKFVYKSLGNHETWTRYKDTLAQIQKELEKYLEDKRNEFPRFYFLSNDELIEILAKANDLEAIQRNIRKCFECVSKIVFQENTRYIESVMSPENELLKINKTNINAKGEIQNWLKLLESSMEETLRKHVAKSHIEYEQSRDRIKFVKEHISQVSLLVCQINWTLDTEAFMENLDEFYKISLKQLTELTAQIRDPELPDQTRRTIVALITQDVHNRDIVEELMENENVTKNDFIWSKQLRFYIEGEGFEAVAKARQVDAQIDYGYEYLGIMSRLVITPLTDRCWMTIIGAINIKLGAAPAGPAGTGKTESTKDLAKGLGILCIVFNCSEQIEFRIMGRLFAGLSQQGAWSCLDEFNRIDIEVLSVIAQQLLTIRVAKLRGDTTFFFNDRNINLRPGCGVFITMNPGYAGRTELPDNLKVLFRSVSMMIPDYRLIAEIMLFAEGFEEAKQLSKKMVQLYKLSSEQLSQQDHYDFGMRAVKSVLVMAGALKRRSKDDSEEEVLIQAMRNSNIPKFLKDDLPLFEALICDLFPLSEIKEVANQALQAQLQETALGLELQVVPDQIKKALQLHDTFNVRFGVMIVGAANSGKTSCCDLLALSLSELHQREKARLQGQGLSQSPSAPRVHRHTLNPKAISMGELYGEVNELTQEWQDGLASSIMRECAQEEDPTANNWVVFDGPVDALWIENMNTVLDDNMMLCLANGERIKLKPQMRMLFEVMDLRVASPATVSRCGMVFMISEQLTWRTTAQSWLDRWCQQMQQLDEGDPCWTQELKAYLTQLFEKCIQPIRAFIAHKVKEPIPTTEIELAKSLSNILEIICTPQYGFQIGQERDYKKKYLTYAFTYSFIWSCCVTALDRYHEDMSYQCRGLIQSVIYPNNDCVQNFYFDTQDIAFRHWNERLPEFVYAKQQTFHEIIVETVDTARYSFVIELLKSRAKPVLITGPSGTGKSIQLLKIDISPLILTSTTSHLELQVGVESKLDKIRKNLLGSASGRINVVAIDDTNMPAQEVYGAIPPVEVLRSLVDKQGIWDRKERFWKNIQNTAFVCACSPPGGGRNQLTPRLTRHFNILCLPEPSHQSLMRIFKSILDGYFGANDFMEIIKKSTETVVNSTVEVYTVLKREKLPIPSQFHYTFNLRDMSKIFQGIMESKRSTCRDVESLGKLWFHECSRVLKDRLNTEEDHKWFHDKLHDVLEMNFRVRKRDSSIYFSNINKLDSREYEEIASLKKVLPTIEELQENHNSENDSKLELVLFNEAIEHILRIQRILTMSRGNGLLLGLAGSGKQSLTRLASYISGHKLSRVEITKGYNVDAFRNFLKSMMRQCSDKNESVTFLFTDNQIVSEKFLEDINNILNSGEIPNLWEIEEKEDIINSTRPFNAALKRSESPATIYRTFVERVRQRLHLILSMSPIGDSLRIRCRKYPALVNCCTIDWFFPWPEDALVTVASAILENYDRLPTYEKFPKRAEVVEIFADVCKEVHISTKLQAKRFEELLKRKVYTTPKTYLDMLRLYLSLLQKKQNEVFEKRDRLKGGLEKLEQAGIQVRGLEKTLKKLKPQLEDQNKMLHEALKVVERDSKEAGEIEAVVSVEADEVAKQKNDIEILTDEARERLKEVEPALEKAKKAVESIDKKQIQVIRAYANPPSIVSTVMDGVCILYGLKGDWDVQKKLLMKLDDFITSLKEYKKDNIPEDRLLKLRNHIQKKEFREEELHKNCRELMEIALWCKAIEKYATVAKEIEPKKKKMAEMQIKLNAANQLLEGKMAVLREAQDKVQKLKNETAEMMAKKTALEHELNLTKERLERAKDLIVLTKDQSVRWKQTVEKMSSEVVNLPFDVFVSAASISYSGPFTGAHRKNLLEYWKTVINSKDVPVSEDCSVSRIMGDPLVIRDWVIDGLPSDTVSIENAIFSKEGNRWPFLIDPQNQALKWLSKALSKTAKKILKTAHSNFQSEMKSAIKNGLPVLLIDVQQTLPAILDSVFSKETKIIDNMPMIKFGDENIYYDNKFRIYAFTKLSNPNFLPEVFIRTNIINFTVTFSGLEEQLLAMVVKHEREEVEKQRDDNIVLMGECNKKLNQSELNILRLLKKASADTILDNIELIDTLKDSQEASKDIKVKMEESKKLESSITSIRQQYESVSTRGSILFFAIKDLSLIDNMYQYSLQYIEKIIAYSMDAAEKSENMPLEKRLASLIDCISRNVYRSVSRGLFEKDKLLFSFCIASSISRQAKLIPEDLWAVFSKGTPPLENVEVKKNPSQSLFTKKSWELACYLENTYAKFFGLCESLSNKVKEWEQFVESSRLSNPMPDGWDSKLEIFDRVLIWRILQPQKVTTGISYYVSNTLGDYYIESPNVTIKDLWKDSDNRTPIIFILSPGADPTSSLLKLASELSIGIDIISLGQGQGEPASKLISKNKSSGKWVLLQNCHLAKTWMPSLERIVEGNFNPDEEIGESFRLFLTSMPALYFPASILQNGIKLTTEPPRGLKVNLKRSWNEIDEEQLRLCPKKTEEYHKMLWGLTFFHAIIQQRQKFGPLGWNIKYEFNESDLETSKTVLQMLINKNDSIPFEALLFVTGEINYGGRVTDDWDRRCLRTILSLFYKPEILNTTYQFSERDEYVIPTFQSIENYRSYIDGLPLQESTAVFGMHSNANTAFLQQQERQLMDTLLSLQPRESAFGAKAPQETVLDIVNGILEKKQVPDLLNVSHGNKEIFARDEKGLLASLNTFLLQEIDRFNVLLGVIKSSLEELKKAIGGLVLMSDELDSMFYSLLINKVPQNWAKHAYPSLKPLDPWVRELNERVRFIRDWLLQGSVNSFWLSSFFFPQGFLTGVLQEYARHPERQIAIDQLVFGFKFTDLTREKCSAKPPEGVYIHGLFLEGASWDVSKRILANPIKNELYFSMPIVHFVPTKISQKKLPEKYDVYECPVYKTSVRAGVLSTTGQSTNFVLAVEAPTSEDPDSWVLQGTAMLLQLNE